MSEIRIDDYEESEYKLDELGSNLIGYALSIEETLTYITGPGIYIELPHGSSSFKQNTAGYFIEDQENESSLQLTNEQYEVISALI